eukprot:351280-Chlamydomonas_euryale.AAC.2
MEDTRSVGAMEVCGGTLQAGSVFSVLCCGLLEMLDGMQARAFAPPVHTNVDGTHSGSLAYHSKQWHLVLRAIPFPPLSLPRPSPPTHTKPLAPTPSAFTYVYSSRHLALTPFLPPF